jgi:murein DD-endopeptidase MepM/ murein hydrolase activator NlpD
MRLARAFLAAAISAAAAFGASAVAPRAQSAPLRVSLSAHTARPGDIVVLTVVPPDALGPVQVEAFGRRVPAFFALDHQWKALVGVDVDVEPGRYPIAADAHDGGRVLREVENLEVEARAFPTRRLTVDPAFVTPPPEVEPRILREARQLETLWSDSAASRLWDGPFVPPVDARPSGQFGVSSIFNGQPRSRHTGEDFPAKDGTPVVAPNAGRVVLAQDLYFAGRTVVIDHGLGCFSLLEHLSRIDVKPGGRVQAGQAIGRVGATGRVTGPHLHWAVRLNGARVDPLSLLALPGL